MAADPGQPAAGDQAFASRAFTEEVALRLHAFADALQADGQEAVRRALADGDYFELLLAGFVAEYLATRSA
jgi:hypothetical protein